MRFPRPAGAFHTGAHNVKMSWLFHWSEPALPDTHVRLIDHAGPWALAKADLGNGRPVPALVSHDRILDLSARPETAGARTVTELLEHWEAVLPVLEAVAADPRTRGGRWPMPACTARSSPGRSSRPAPTTGRTSSTSPRHITTAATDAASSRYARTRPPRWTPGWTHPPFVFTGLPSAICGPYDDVVLPRDGEQPDWELELAAVIGRPTRRVAVTEALDAVAGWVIVNDLTLRDKVFRPRCRPARGRLAGRQELPDVPADRAGARPPVGDSRPG